MFQNSYYVVLLLGRFVLFPLWWLCGFLPRRRDLWVFGSWGGYRFADNGASFFRHCHAHLRGRVRVVWISRDRGVVERVRSQGYEAHLAWSLLGMAICARAGLHLFDCFAKDTNFWLGRGAIKINLWSGVPLKAFERDIDRPGSRYYDLFHGALPERWLLSLMMPWHVERPDLIIATSDETAEITARAFDVPRERVVVTGYPRNDILLASGDGPPAEALPSPFAAAVAAGEAVFLYLPTFRDKPGADAGIDWRGLYEMLARHNARLFCKSHPVGRTVFDTSLERIVELPRDIDVYPLLRHTRALISDYSSIIFDYMLIDRQIVYYMPDLEAFVSGNRRLNFQPADVAIGPICTNSEQLVRALERIALGESPAGPRQRGEVLRRLHAHVDADASRRVLEAIEKRYPQADIH